MTERADIIPPEIAEEYELFTVLKGTSQRRTLLLRRRRDGQPAVLKCTRGEEAAKRQVYEAVRALDGDGVPRILKILDYQGTQYVLREYVEGKTLLELCGERGPFSAGEAADIGVRICGILERFHGLDTPLIHRDIKAENVVLTPDGRCVLIDFGIARFYNEMDSRDTTIIGTGFAAAPEQFGYAQTDARSDVYSLGVLLHELSTGEYVRDKGVVPLKLRHVVDKCTRFDPSDRYQNVVELKKALFRVKRSPRRLAAVLSAALAIALAVTLFFSLRPAPSKPSKTDIYTFASPELGAEVARQLGKEVKEITREDLSRITAIRLIGTYPFENWDDILAQGEAISLNGQTFEGMEAGSISTLVDIPEMTNLTELCLCNQEISDLAPLKGSHLVRLALHGNAVSDLDPLRGCRELTEFYISNNPVSDISPLAGMPNLGRLNLGATDIRSLEPLKEIPKLVYLEMLDCPGIRSLEGIEELRGLANLLVRPVTHADLARIDTLTGLLGLGIWSPEPFDDLTIISDLTDLRYLYADITFLSSVEGIEGMKLLNRLDLRSSYPLNAAPLAGLAALEDVNFDFMYSDSDWSEVSGLENLKYATISPADEASFRAALGDRDVNIFVSPG